MKILMKIGPYSPTTYQETTYDSINKLCLQTSNPGLDLKKFHSDKNNIKHDIGDSKIVLCSDSNRAVETICYLKKENVIDNRIKEKRLLLLREIKFDISNMFTEKEYRKKGSDVVRERFLDFFVTDNLVETRKEIQSRVNILDKLILLENKDMLIISHTFFIKIYLIYKARPELFDNPEVIKEYINPQKRIMNFCETFQV